MHEVDARDGDAGRSRRARLRRPGDARHDGPGQPVRAQRRPRRSERSALVPRTRRDPAARALAAIETGFARAHRDLPAMPPRSLREATHRRRPLGPGAVRAPRREGRHRALQLDWP